MSSSISGLTEKQYNKIIKYWSKIEKLENKINKYSNYIQVNIGINYGEYLDIDEVDETIDYFVSARDALEQYELFKNELIYLKSEYENYINELGYQFSDTNQDEKLFQLINNGILI